MAIELAWIGAVTDTTAVVKARSDQSSASLTGAGSVSGVEGNDDVFTFTLTGLTADTLYTIEIDDGGGTWDGSFTTTGSNSFTVAAASCCGQNGVGGVADADSFARIEDRAPDLFIHMGDLHYKDITTNNVGVFRSAYQDALTQTKFASLLQSVPVSYAFDDHDFGANNSDGTSASAPAAQLAYRDYAPHHTLPVTDGIYQTWVMGRVRFIQLDVRSFRNLETDSMLGTTQLDWLLDLLDTMTEEALILVTVVPWQGANAEGFGGFTDERQTIAESLTVNNLAGRTLMLHGDIHMCATDDGTNTQFDPASAGNGPHAACFAPLNATTSAGSDTYSQGPVTDSSQQYGTIDVTDTGDAIAIRSRAWAVTGATETEVADSTLTITLIPGELDMTAETDIAALTDGGGNPISEIRTAFTSVLARADVTRVIDTVTLAVDTATVDFTSIPSGYSGLKIIGRARMDSTTTRSDEVLMRFGNGTIDSGANYDYFSRATRSDGADLNEDDQASTHIPVAGSVIPANMTGAEAGEMGQFSVEIWGYADTSFFKSCTSQFFGSTRGDADRVGTGFAGGVWRSTSAIDAIRLYGENSDFLAGSNFILIGIA